MKVAIASALILIGVATIMGSIEGINMVTWLSDLIDHKTTIKTTSAVGGNGATLV